MFKILHILLCLILVSNYTNAQGWYTVTHTSGKQKIAGVDVEVKPINGGVRYIPGNYCGAGPYFIGTNGSGPFTTVSGFKFIFSKPARRVRYQITASDYGEVLAVELNGAPYSLTAANLSYYTGYCGNNGNSKIISGVVCFDSATGNNNTEISLGGSGGVDSTAITDVLINAGSTMSFQFIFDTTLAVVNYTDTLLCVGDSIHIPYEITGSYLQGNVFTFQLSDKNGSFTAPTVLGTITGTESGIFRGVLPNSLLPGGEYRVRVLASNPVFISAPSRKIGIGNLPVFGLFTTAPVCENDSFLIGATSFSHVTDYVWNGPGLLHNYPSQHIRIPNSKVSNAGMYHLTVHDFGCVANDSIAVVIRGNPLHNIGSNNSPLCSGDTLKLISNIDTGAVVNIWQTPDGTLFKTNDVFLPGMQAKDTGLYILTTALDGCTTRDTARVIIKQRPDPGALGATGCTGDSLVITSANIANAVYAWSGPGGYTSANRKNVFYNIPLSIAGKYIISATVNGCAGYDTVDVIVKPKPYEFVAKTNTPVCDGQTLHMYANDTMSAALYSWTGPGAYFVTHSSAEISSVTSSAAGRYILTADLNGCTRSDTADVAVKPTPKVSGATSNSPLSVGQDLYLIVPDTESGVGYTWQGPHSFYSALTSPVINKVQLFNAGTYTVTGSLNGCTSTSLVLVTIETVKDTGIMVLYPNPNNGKFIIKAVLKRDQDVPLHITNAVGQLIHTAYARTHNKLLEYNFDLKDALSSGIYVLRLTIDGKTRSILFVVDKSK